MVWVSASLSSSLILTLSIMARGRVFRPVAAQNREMFCETMPASSAPHSDFVSGVPRMKRSESETRMSWTGGLEGGGGGGGGVAAAAPAAEGVAPAGGAEDLGGRAIMSWERKSPARTGSNSCLGESYR